MGFPTLIAYTRYTAYHMAIYHLSMKPISRGKGRSAVAAAAYRAGERLHNEREGLTHDFTNRQGVAHAEIVLPGDSVASWALDREQLWNEAEAVEKRKDARTAREFEVALPHEMNDEQRLELVRQFTQELADRYGTAVDFAIHRPDDEGDNRNHHAHIMMTTRSLGPEGLGEKTMLEWENKKLLAEGLPTSKMQLHEIRLSWEQITNRELARAGINVRVDHRSHKDRGLEIDPTRHVGVQATHMQRSGKDVERNPLHADSPAYNAALIERQPEQILKLITQEKSVFDRHDIARAIHRYTDNVEDFQNCFHAVMASRQLVELQAETPQGDLAKLSTREMVATERGMADQSQRMAWNQSYAVKPAHVEKAVARQDRALSARVGKTLSTEQRQAIQHITGPEQLAAVVGVAGAGKSTMLAAAREAWEAQGYRVRGAALAGKAAEGLEESSGIQSRTLASYEFGWQTGRDPLSRGDVLVIDEAGMIGSRQLSKFIDAAHTAGAKVVLVGDPEQLQAIGAGAAYRAITERTGFASLQNVLRQREEWQQQASRDFARHRTSEALAAYDKHGALKISTDGKAAITALVRDYMADMKNRKDGSRLALAHRRVDVQALNDAIRAERSGAGELSGARAFKTQNGVREFAPGDRLVFLENNRDLAVKNGMLATVESVTGSRINVRLDGTRNRRVSVPVGQYAAIDHGYATTIHKSQGATTDRAFVLTSRSMDRHLSYVAMTRHKDSARMYAAQDEFKDFKDLTRILRRARQKETTLDYPTPDKLQRPKSILGEFLDLTAFFGSKTKHDPEKRRQNQQRQDREQGRSRSLD